MNQKISPDWIGGREGRFYCTVFLQLCGTYLFSVVVFVTDVERQEAEPDGNLALELFTVEWTEGEKKGGSR